MIIVSYFMKQKLRKALMNKLPGPSAHQRMTSAERRFQMQHLPDPYAPRKSSVLILLYEKDEELRTIMIQRPKYDGVHSGQIAFPGGKMEDSDADLTATALRETEEEIGLPGTSIEVIGQLTELYIYPSNFLVQPIVGWLNQEPVTKADPDEVEEILTFPVLSFMKTEARQEREVVVKDSHFKVPCYVVSEYIIWGATAMIMTEFLEVMESAIA